MHAVTINRGVRQIRGNGLIFWGGLHYRYIPYSGVGVSLIATRQCPALPDNFLVDFTSPLTPQGDKYMRSKKVELRLPHEINEGAVARSEKENYRNCKRYITGVVVEDILHPRKHSALVHTIANADPELQDMLLDQFFKASRAEVSQIMIAAVKNGKKARSV